ncbi:MAG: hypothetical protein EG822_17535 [Deltaproteobacteria bacterium]|nr:hypothetical protein [Deltaproteobacteria bacterium]TLN03309.1 MAG: hypothetical protein FDZ73_08445 [bacterium]
MFLKKLFGFGKDYNYYLEKADRYLAAERFADARIAYGEALEKLEASDAAVANLIGPVRQKISLTGNMLGQMNLVEAEYALSSGDRKKAEEHLRIILELADEANLRENAQKLLAGLDVAVQEAPAGTTVPACNNCGEQGPDAGNGYVPDLTDAISREDRLALYFQTLPGDLSARYAAMGEDFARGCLLNLEGDGEGALRVFEGISAGRESDILDYEKAILYFHQGAAEKCEHLLLKAGSLNPENALCQIGLVQLYTETGREAEALQVLERMVEGNLLPEQALLMQGDLHLQMKDESKAVESYSRLLTSPSLAKDAAQRLIPLLQNQGRGKEAAFLAKKYAKGCC